jgi:hypothetical protein
VQVGDLKGRNAMMKVDALWMENGIVLVWDWGVKDGEMLDCKGKRGGYEPPRGVSVIHLIR